MNADDVMACQRMVVNKLKRIDGYIDALGFKSLVDYWFEQSENWHSRIGFNAEGRFSCRRYRDVSRKRRYRQDYLSH